MRFPARLATIFRHRQVLGVLVKKDFDTRYAGSIFGVLWTQIYPLMLMGVYTFFFTVVFKSSTPHYPLFLFMGIVVFTFFSTSITLSTGSVLANGSLIANVSFPNELVTVSAVVLALIDLVTSHVIVLAGAGIYGVTPSWSWLALPPIVLLLLLFCLGLGLLLATANVYLRDVKYFVDVAVLMLMFLSPVFYAASALPSSLAWLMKVNPLAIALIAYRQAMLDHTWPNPHVWADLSVVGLTFLFLGLEVFARGRKGFVDAL
ncbi:MAG: ABC transporter permease [Chloroflexota bacterium]|nr:ABC transporter permease [Chloroflexota bacterium]